MFNKLHIQHELILLTLSSFVSFFISYSTSIGQPKPNNGPYSVREIEDIACLNATEFEDYFNRDGFKKLNLREITSQAYEYIKGEEMSIIISREKTNKATFLLKTNSIDRRNRIINSLKSAGYVYMGDRSDMLKRLGGTVIFSFEDESDKYSIFLIVNDVENLKRVNQDSNFPVTNNSVSTSNWGISSNKVDVYSGPSQGNIFVKAGSTISLKATGVVRFGAFAGSGYADGIDGFTAYNKVSGFRHGALLGRVNNEPWLLIGTNASYKFNRDGVLTLLINDNSPDDNQGSFIVEYSINDESKGTINNVSTSENNKFVIRNSYKSKVNFELSRDKSEWTSYSLNGLSQSDYWYTDQQQSFFRIKMLTTKVYKIEAGKKYKIDWNKSEWCFDLFSDGDR
ncbi:hypothetical protein GCM10028808_01790 [Spirosoma migulaei]